MAFCTTCGRQRSGPSRFCTGCGTQFSDPLDAAPAAADVAAQPAPPDVKTPAPAQDSPAPAQDWVPLPAETVLSPPPAFTSPPPSETVVEDLAGADPGQTRADPWAAFSEQPGTEQAGTEQAGTEQSGQAEPAPSTADPSPSNPDQTRWDTRWYRSGPNAVQPPAAPAEAEPPGLVPGLDDPTRASQGGAYAQQSFWQGGYGQESPAQPGWSGFPGQPGYDQTGYGPPSYGQGPPAQGPYGPVPPHVPGAPSSGPRRSQTAILVTVLVLVLVAVGGGAYALVSKYTGHKAAGPHNPTVSAPARTPTSSGKATATSPATGTATASPTRSPKPSHTPKPKPKPKAGLVISPAATANPAEPRVAALVNQYFTAINTHNYTAYNALLVSSLQANDTPSSFQQGYGTTKDLHEQLTSISDTGGGGEAATLSFTSNQSAADSPTHTTCTNWTITLYLVPNGSSYLIGPAASGYHAHFAAC